MSIKGRNSVVNLRITNIYNTNVDLVNDNVYTKFSLNLYIDTFSRYGAKTKFRCQSMAVTLLQVCQPEDQWPCKRSPDILA